MLTHWAKTIQMKTNKSTVTLAHTIAYTMHPLHAQHRYHSIYFNAVRECVHGNIALGPHTASKSGMVTAGVLEFCQHSDKKTT